MNRNVYLNIIATILLVSVIVIGLAVVKSIDLMRDRAEQATKQLDSIQTRIGNLERKISEVQVSSSATSQQKGQDQKTDKAEPQSAKIANFEYYDPNAESGGRLVSAIDNETKNMNYLINNESFVSTIWEYATDSLTDRNLEHIEIFEPKLAESWSLSEDKTTYTIKIRKGFSGTTSQIR